MMMQGLANFKFTSVLFGIILYGLWWCPINALVQHSPLQSFHFRLTEFSRHQYGVFLTHLTDTGDNTHVVYEHLLTATVPREQETLYSNAYTCAFGTGLQLYRKRLALICILLLLVFPCKQPLAVFHSQVTRDSSLLPTAKQVKALCSARNKQQIRMKTKCYNHITYSFKNTRDIFKREQYGKQILLCNTQQHV